MSKILTYEDILSLDTASFLIHMQLYQIAISTEITSSDGAKDASRTLGDLSNLYSDLSALLSAAKIQKRIKKREKETALYEDLIDKEAIIEVTLKSLDLQYKALSKAISLYMENMKELYMLQG